MKLLLLLATFPLIFTSCGGDGGCVLSGESVGTCTFSTSCTEFGTGYSAATAQQSCTSGGIFSSITTTCSATGIVGRCSATLGGYSTLNLYYDASTLTAIETLCTTQGGTFCASN